MERTVLFGKGVGEKGEEGGGRLFKVHVLIRSNTVRICLKMAAGAAGLNSPSSAFQSFSNLNTVALKKNQHP